MGYDKLGTTSPVAVTDTGSAAAGTSTEVAKKDHAHALAVAGEALFTTAVPATFTNGRRVIAGAGIGIDVSVAGQATFTAPGGAGAPAYTLDPEDVDVGGAGPSPGASASYSRGDHVHAIAIGAPVNVGLTNAAGTANDVPRSDHVHADPQVARWALTDMRYFLLDPDGGNDSQTGFVDATPGSTIAPAGLPKKTWAALKAIIPPNGNGRLAKILIKPRAAGATIAEAFSLAGVSGYAWLGKCGSSDLTNNATDRIKAGGITFLAGPGGGGVWTVATVASDNEVTVTGTIPAGSDDGFADSVVGCRARWTGNVTGALANACVTIWHATAGAGATINFSTLPASPAAGDTFLIEAPGVNFRSFRDVDAQQAFEYGGTPPFGVELISPTVGIATNEASSPNFGDYFVGGVGIMHYAFCGARGTTLPTFANLATRGHVDTLSFGQTYLDEEGNEIAVGGCRFAGEADITCERLKVGPSGFNLSSGPEVDNFTTIDLRAADWQWACTDDELDPCVLAQGGNIHVGQGGYNQLIGVRVQNRDLRDGCLEVFLQGSSLYLAEGTFVNNGSTSHASVKVHNENPSGSSNAVGGTLIIAALTAGGSTPRTLVDLTEASSTTLVMDGSSDAGAGGGILMDGGPIAGDILVPIGNTGNTNIIDYANNTLASSIYPAIRCVAVVNDTEVAIAIGKVLAPDGESSIATVPAVLEADRNAESSSTVLGVSAMTIPADGGVGFATVAGTPYIATAFGGDDIGLPAFVSTSGDLSTTPPAVGSGQYRTPVGVVVAPHYVTWHPQTVGTLVLLENVLGSDAQDIDFTGLNGDADKAYHLRVWGRVNGASVTVRYNGGSTRTAIWQKCNGTTVTAGSDPELGGVGFFSAGDIVAIDMVFNTQRDGSSGPFCSFKITKESSSGGTPVFVTGMVYSSDIGANLNAIRLRGDSGTFWDTGVNYSIERVPAGG